MSSTNNAMLTDEQREFLVTHFAEWRAVGMTFRDAGRPRMPPDPTGEFGDLLPVTWTIVEVTESDCVLVSIPQSNAPNWAVMTQRRAHKRQFWQDVEFIDLNSHAVCGILADWLTRKWCAQSKYHSVRVTEFGDGHAGISLDDASGTWKFHSTTVPKGNALLSALMWAYTSPDSPVREEV